MIKIAQKIKINGKNLGAQDQRSMIFPISVKVKEFQHMRWRFILQKKTSHYRGLK